MEEQSDGVKMNLVKNTICDSSLLMEGGSQRQYALFLTFLMMGNGLSLW